MESSLNDITTQAMREEKKKLRRVFRRFDMVFYSVTAVIMLSALGAFSALWTAGRRTGQHFS